MAKHFKNEAVPAIAVVVGKKIGRIVVTKAIEALVKEALKKLAHGDSKDVVRGELVDDLEAEVKGNISVSEIEDFVKKVLKTEKKEAVMHKRFVPLCGFFISFGPSEYLSADYKTAAIDLVDVFSNILKQEVDADITPDKLWGLYFVDFDDIEKDVYENKVKKIEDFVRENKGTFKGEDSNEYGDYNEFELDPIKVFDFHNSGSDEDEIIEELLKDSKVICRTNVLDSRGNQK